VPDALAGDRSLSAIVIARMLQSKTMSVVGHVGSLVARRQSVVSARYSWFAICVAALVSAISGCVTYDLGGGLTITTGRKSTGADSNRDYYLINADVGLPPSSNTRVLEMRAWNDHHVSHPLRRSRMGVQARGRVLATATVETREIDEFCIEHASFGWGVAGGTLLRAEVPPGIRRVHLRWVWGDWFCGMEVSDVRLLDGPLSEHPLPNPEAPPSVPDRPADCDLTSLPVVDERASVAVLDFQVLDTPNSAIGASLADICREAILASDRYRLVDRENMRALLDEEDWSKTVRCDETKCLVSFGKKLRAQKIVHGRISSIGNTFLLTLKMLDVSTTRIDGVKTTKITGGIEGVVDHVEPVTCEVLRDALKKNRGRFPVG